MRLSLDNKLLWVAGIFSVLLFIATIQESFAFYTLPFVLFSLYCIFFEPRWALYIVAFFVPLSVNTGEYIPLPFALYVPTEAILIMLMLLYVCVQLIQPVFEKRIFSHPIFVTYCFYLIWILITSFTSMSPLVSFKFLIAHCWLFFPVFIFSAQFFRHERTVRIFFWLITASMSIVAVYTLVRHAGFAFAEKPAHWVMEPFFKDHTSYGALLALVFPILIGLIYSKKQEGIMPYVSYFLLALFVLALVFSYTRAAWLSLVCALGIQLIIYFRIRFSTILILMLAGGFLFLVSYDKIMMDLASNTTDSSEDFGKHLTSVSNISTDASNVERLNRWDCAISMYNKKPLTGWGPGTYQFYYAPFQRPENLTIISTYNADGGNAHSEYLGPLSESGWPGLVLFVLVVFVMFYRGFTNYRYIQDKSLRRLYVSALLGLATYFIHGFLNNYLDTDKAAVPVWGIAGLIAAIDIYYVRKPGSEKETA